MLAKKRNQAMEDDDYDGLSRREVLATLFSATLLTGAGSTASAQSEKSDDRGSAIKYPPADAKLLAEIDSVLKRTEEIWSAQEWWRLPDEIWDRQDPTPMYVAEELYDVMIGWDILDKYIFPPKKGLDAFRWGYSNLWVKELAPGVALALYDHWFEIKIKVPGPIGVPRHGFDRVLSIYNLRDDGWRQSLYAQCPLGPDTYVRAMAEKLVKPDFDEFYARVKAMDIKDPRLK
jgi:hypothetical protein